jgi:hypothetical protein
MSEDAVSQQEEIQPNPVSSFRLLDAIDRQRIGDDLAGWVALAFGVHTRGCESWVQVASQDHSRSVILHMPRAIDAACVLAALQAFDLSQAYSPDHRGPLAGVKQLYLIRRMALISKRGYCYRPLTKR